MSAMNRISLHDRLILLLLAAGVGLRLWALLGGRSLWLDEAMVAESIVGRDWAELAQPLANMQVAPLGWLYIERAFIVVFGDTDLALRLPQLLAGLAALGLFAWGARRIFTPLVAIVAIALFALSPQLIRYSAEVKPYGVDALVTVGALFFYVRYFWQNAPLSRVDIAALAAFGAAAVAVSLPAAFVLAGLGAALFLREAIARRWLWGGALAFVGVIWLALFAALVLPMVQNGEDTVSGMQGYWGEAFAPFPIRGLQDLKWYITALTDLIAYVFGAESWVVAAIAIAVGSVLAWRRNWLLLAALAMPALVAMLASGLGLYAFQGRLLLFLAPILIALTALALEAVIQEIRHPKAAAAGFATAVLVGSAFGVWGEFTYFPSPYGSEPMKPVLGYVAGARDQREPIFVNFEGSFAFRRYAASAGLGDAQLIYGAPLHGSLACALEDVERISSQGRAWAVFSHTSNVMQGKLTEDQAFVAVADAVGKRVTAVEAISTHAYLYEFGTNAPARIATLKSILAPEACAS